MQMELARNPKEKSFKINFFSFLTKKKLMIIVQKYKKIEENCISPYNDYKRRIFMRSFYITTLDKIFRRDILADYIVEIKVRIHKTAKIFYKTSKRSELINSNHIYSFIHSTK